MVSRKLSAEEFDKLEEIAKINSVKIIEEKDIIGTLSEQSFEESGEGYALKRYRNTYCYDCGGWRKLQQV